MGKLTNMFSKVSIGVKETFSKFPITIIIVYGLTVILALFLDSEFIDSEILSKIMFVGGISLVGILFVEVNKEKIKRPFQYIGMAISFGIALIFYILLEMEIDFGVTVLRWLGAYVITMVLLIFYSFSKNSKVEFKEFILKLSSNISAITATYIILNIGIFLLSLAFIELILDGEGWSLVGRLLILLLGIFYIPNLIHSLIDMKVEVSKFDKKLLLNVFIPLISIGMIIIYMYIFKLVINEELPKKSIFMMLAIIFVVLYPTCIKAMNYKEENKIAGKAAKILMYLYIPFIVLEIYAISLRVGEYGLTETRYFAYVFIIFQIVFIFMTLFKGSKYIKESILVAAGLTIITFVTPLNFVRISNLSQMKILDEYVENGVEFEECSKEEKAKYAGAYKYLRNEDEKYLSNLSEKDKKILNDYNERYFNYYNGSYYDSEDYDEEYVDDTYNYEDLYYVNKLDGLDVSEYSKIYEFKTNRNNYKNYLIIYGNKVASIDLENYIEEIIDANDEGEAKEYFEKNSIIKIDEENVDIYLTSISLQYDLRDESIQNIRINGYVLER